MPSAGIKILNDDASICDIDIAELRINKLQLDKVFSHLHRFVETLPLNEKLRVGSFWERLRSRLERSEQNIFTFPKLNLSTLPKQRESTVLELQGEIFPETLNEADFNDEFRSGLVVCIYSDVKKGRSWCGRILRVDEGRKFLLQWYSKKKGSSNTFVASFNSDGSPYTSLLDTETVMLWNFSSDIDNTSFHINNYFVT